MVVYRYLFWLLASMMGIVGISAGFMVMMTHIASSGSFGVPLLSSFSKQEMKDTFLRLPLKTMIFRPSSLLSANERRHRSP
jgi:hypothetical protein